jgi:hypothetical protein
LFTKEGGSDGHENAGEQGLASVVVVRLEEGEEEGF